MSLYNMLSPERLAEIQAIHDRCGGWKSQDAEWLAIPQEERNAWFVATGQLTKKQKANQRRFRAAQKRQREMSRELAALRDEAVQAVSDKADLAR
jgi:hypothetical protein